MTTNTNTKPADSFKVRTTQDGYMSIYDIINSFNLGREASEIWKEVQEHVPSIKDIVSSKQFFTINVRGRKTPHSTPCISSQEMQVLISAIQDWKENYKKSDYTIRIYPMSSNANIIPFEVKPKSAAVLRTPTYVVGKETFNSSTEIEQRLKGILKNTKANSYVEGEDKIFMINLLSQCEYAKALLKKGLYGIKVQHLVGHSHKNFALEVPGKTQKISIANYLNPSKNKLFNVTLLTR
jgi:hypothetical protein